MTMDTTEIRVKRAEIEARLTEFETRMLRTGPLMEGERPGALYYDEEGNLQRRELPEYEPYEPVVTEKYVINDKEEFYDYMTTCKQCGADFMAYDSSGNAVRNYCPCCGERLTSVCVKE